MWRRYLSGLLLLALWGCGSTAGTVVTLDTVTGEKKITTHSAKFAGMIKVEDIIYRKLGDIIVAQVKLTNQSNKSLMLELTGKWYDAEGFEVDDPKELWRHIIINGKETKTVKLVAPRKDAVKLEIITREGKAGGNY